MPAKPIYKLDVSSGNTIQRDHECLGPFQSEMDTILESLDKVNEELGRKDEEIRRLSDEVADQSREVTKKLDMVVKAVLGTAAGKGKDK